MLATIVTWVGASLGIAVLVTMALGAFIVDAESWRLPRPFRRNRTAAPSA